MKPITWRSAAERDTADAAYWYASEAGLPMGERFLAAVGAGITHVSHHPASGSGRYAMPLQFEGLRVSPVHGFRYLIFYVEHVTHVDVWRVLHAQRDIPEWMEGSA